MGRAATCDHGSGQSAYFIYVQTQDDFGDVSLVKV